jgi:hypothetical protein
VVQDEVTGALNQPFQTSQQLLDLLKNLPGAGPNKATSTVENSDLKYTLQLDKTIQKSFPFQFDVASAVDLHVAGSITVDLVIQVDATFGVNKDTRIFFIKQQSAPVFTAHTTTTLMVSGESRLGFLGLSINGATANLNTDLGLRLTDTGADDLPFVVPAVGFDPPSSPGKIMATELLVGPLSDIFHADFSGFAAASLPLVASLGDYSRAGTLTANWPDVKQPSAFVLDTSQIQDMLRFQSITPEMVLAGIQALPSLLRQLAGSDGLARSLPVLGTNAQGLITLANQIDQLLTTFAQFDTAQKLLQELQSRLAPILSPATIDVNVATDIRFMVGLHQVTSSPALGFNINTQIPGANIGFQASAQAAATAAVDVNLGLGVSFDAGLAAADRFYVITGTPAAPVSQGALSLAIQNTEPIVATATLGALQVGITNGTLSLTNYATQIPPTPMPPLVPASIGIALKDPSASPDGKLTLREIQDLTSQGRLRDILDTPTTNGKLHVDLPVTLPPGLSPQGCTPLEIIADWQWQDVSGLAAPPQITVTFSEGINPIDARAPASYELRGAGPNGAFDDGDDVVYPLTPQYTTGTTVTIGVPVAVGLVPVGNYRFTIFSSAATSIHDLGGLALDGDGSGGELGNYVRVFKVIEPNHPPAFTKGGDVSASDESGLQTLVAWATAISPGSPGESAQALTFIVTTDHDELFAALPAIALDGTLTFAPAPNVFGIVHVAVVLHDDGGTVAGGSDSSLPRTFTITLTKLHPWHNAKNVFDIDGDMHVAPIDTLEIINYINAFAAGRVPDNAVPGPPYLDPSNDGFIAPNDALMIINHINAHLDGEGEGEMASPSGAPEPIKTTSPISASVTPTPVDFDDLLTILAWDIASSAPRRRLTGVSRHDRRLAP